MSTPLRNAHFDPYTVRHFTLLYDTKILTLAPISEDMTTRPLYCELYFTFHLVFPLLSLALFTLRFSESEL